MCCSNPAAGICDIKLESEREQQAGGKGEKQIEQMVESVNGSSSSEASHLPNKGQSNGESEMSRFSEQAQPERLGEENSWLAQYLEGILENNVINPKANHSHSGQDTQPQKQERQEDQIVKTNNTLINVNEALPSENVNLDSLLGNMDEFVEIEMDVTDHLEEVNEQFQDIQGQCIDLVTV